MRVEALVSSTCPSFRFGAWHKRRYNHPIISALAWTVAWFSVKFVRQGLNLVGQASEAV